MLGDRPESEFLATADSNRAYLTLMRGSAFEEETLRWSEFVLEALASRTGLDARPSHASAERCDQ